MIRHAFVLIGLLIVSLTGCATRAPVQLTVLTYNIHRAQGMDKKLDVERIARIIRDCEPDLVALQEVDDRTTRTGGVDQAAELGRLTKMHATYGPAMEFMGGRYGNAVLSRVRPQSSRLVALPGSGGKHEPRSVIAVTCKVGGREVVFASTHLDHMREPSDRLDQASIIDKAFRNERRPMILGGDFNCRVGSPPMNLLAQSYMIATADDATATNPPDQPVGKIDHVLVKPPGRWRVVETTVIDEPVASDHRPVLAKLVLE